MLDSETRRRIDSLRNILVGKIPSPQAQVEQITIGLMYKFMYDMDLQAVEMGGAPTFFVGDYEKYSWKHLFDAKLGGADRVKLYREAIETMDKNKNALPLFREIFKNSFLPFQDAQTLHMFLKGIHEFTYSHSEKLGDAFEYLLSFMGSQGDAGQFRTPRHIIDFIVAAVNPQKNEKILDPACGTAGFLVSAYKHILAQNSSENAKMPGDKLSTKERKKLGEQLSGYDISPDMVRISLMNMYLHQFAQPQIFEYDTLSSEDKWNEYYDVILANPPFFSPKGGVIKPHSRFAVRSGKAEVLFVSYIMEHLEPGGRAGVVVPEGIIFQTGAAYKTLRKRLVEDCLVGVVSLPAGVFQPYSGVKTSVLILHKGHGRESIFFAKVEHDGFSLGAQRTPIAQNDLPKVLDDIYLFLNEQKTALITAKKIDIANFSYNLSMGNYQSQKEILSQFNVVQLKEVVTEKPVYGSGAKKIPFDGVVRYIRITDITDDGRLKTFDAVSPSQIEEQYFLNAEDFLIARSGSVGRSYLHGKMNITCQFAGYLIKFPLNKNKVLPKFLFFITKSENYWRWINLYKKDGTISNINAKEYLNFSFPLPPIETQQKIVEELEGYQKIIDGCRQVVENYKPTIDIDPSWPMLPLGEVFRNITDTIKPDEISSELHRCVGLEHIEKGTGLFIDGFDGGLDEIKSNKIKFKADDILYAKLRPNLNKTVLVDFDGICSTDILVLRAKENDCAEFYHSLFLSNHFNYEVMRGISGAQLPRTKFSFISDIIIPRPKFEMQQLLVNRIRLEKQIILGNKRLIEIYNQKIQDRISKVWGK